jgi:hypothetical protein
LPRNLRDPDGNDKNKSEKTVCRQPHVVVALVGSVEMRFTVGKDFKRVDALRDRDEQTLEHARTRKSLSANPKENK